MHPDGLNLRSQAAATSQTGDEGQLQGAHDLVSVLDDHEELGRIGVDRLERTPVGLDVLLAGGPFPGAAQGVGRKEPHKSRQVVQLGSAQFNGGGGQLQGG
jgi:hypothetical protein